VFAPGTLAPNPPAITFAVAFLPAMAQLCARLRETYEASVSVALQYTGLGLTLLDAEALEDAVSVVVATELHRGETQAQAVRAVLQSFTDALAVSSTDLSLGAPVFCAYNRTLLDAPSCHDAFAAVPSIAAFSTILAGARFQAAFDTRKPPVGNPCRYATWSCSLSASLVGQPHSFGSVGGDDAGFPLSLLDVALWNATLGLPADTYVGHVSAPSLTHFRDLFTTITEFMLRPGPELHLRPGILTVDHEKYYEACAPRTCIYFEAERAPFGEIAADFFQEDFGTVLESCVRWVELAAVLYALAGTLRHLCHRGRCCT